MKDDRRTLLLLQLGVYAVETAMLVAILTLAASRSPEFVLGPLGRLLVAAALPLPCHMLWLLHLVWQGKTLRVTALPSYESLRPIPVLTHR